MPRACIGAVRIGQNTGLHWLREVQGGQFGRGADADGMPRLGDDIGPGNDLRLQVTQDIAAGKGAGVPDRVAHPAYHLEGPDHAERAIADVAHIIRQRWGAPSGTIVSRHAIMLAWMDTA